MSSSPGVNMSSSSHFEPWHPHTWHGLDAGSDPPRVLQACIEITPFDAVEYEIDKETGYLRADRPQRTSSLPPVPFTSASVTGRAR